MYHLESHRNDTVKNSPLYSPSEPWLCCLKKCDNIVRVQMLHVSRWNEFRKETPSRMPCKIEKHTVL